MNPEFWLVLLRLLRVPLTAALGTIPLMVIVLGVFGDEPIGLFSRTLAGLIGGMVFSVPAMPVLALERVPERWQGSRTVRGVRVFYLLGGVGLAGLLLIAFDTSSDIPVVERIGNVLKHVGFLMAVFHLYISVPLIADQLNHHFSERPLVFALPWGLSAVVYMALIWTLAAAFEPFPGQSLRPDGAPMLPPILLVGGWPLGLAAGRVMMTRLMERAEEAARDEQAA